MFELDSPYHDIDVHERFEAEARGERPNITKLRNGDQLFDQILSLYKECTNKLPTARPTARAVVRIFATLCGKK